MSLIRCASTSRFCRAVIWAGVSPGGGRIKSIKGSVEEAEKPMIEGRGRKATIERMEVERTGPERRKFGQRKGVYYNM